MEERRDLYEVLGVARTATAEEIRKAYRQAALKHHPDRNSGDAGAAARFKEATEAFQVLSDDQKRALYDQYVGSVFRYVRYRVPTAQIAEDITSDTFLRALRRIDSFTWQGRDIGAWFLTIARNLTTDHFKAGRTRLEMPTEDMTPHDNAEEGPESAVLAGLTNEALLKALTELPTEQRECLIMRFLQGLSIAETALSLDRSDGAVKQLQLRGVRNLAKLLPDGLVRVVGLKLK